MTFQSISGLNASSPAVSNSVQLAGLRESFKKAQDKPISIFQYDEFNVQVTPNVHGNLIVEACRIDSDFWDWAYITISDSMSNSLESAIEWIERGKFISYQGSLLRVGRIPEGFIGEVLGADGVHYSTALYDDEPDQACLDTRQIADRVREQLTALEF